MKIRYTLKASRQFTKVLTELEAQSPQGAARVVARIEAAMNMLILFPRVGRQTRRRRVRRVTISPFPYNLDYRVDTQELVILGLRHTSRRPLS